jgi:hypothetical protein
MDAIFTITLIATVATLAMGGIAALPWTAQEVDESTKAFRTLGAVPGGTVRAGRRALQGVGSALNTGALTGVAAGN